MGDPPESSDRDLWNRGDSESSSSSRTQGDTGGLETGLVTELSPMGLAPPPSAFVGAGIWIVLGWSSCDGSGSGLRSGAGDRV